MVEIGGGGNFVVFSCTTPHADSFYSEAQYRYKLKHKAAWDKVGN